MRSGEAGGARECSAAEARFLFSPQPLPPEALPHTSSSSAGCRASRLLQASKNGVEWVPRGGDVLVGVQAQCEKCKTDHRFDMVLHLQHTTPLPPECSPSASTTFIDPPGEQG